MGLPSVNISFTEKAATSIKRSQRGVVGLILKDTQPTTNPFTVIQESDIPSTLSDANKDYIAKAMLGYTYGPRKIICYVQKTTATSYTDAFTAFEKEHIDYLACPTVETDALSSSVVTWVKAQRALDNMVKAVLPNTTGDCEGIINYTTAAAIIGTKTYTAEQYTPRIAGLLAGTPLTISSTFAPLNELDNCTRLSKTDLDTAIDAGKFVIFWDNEKVKVARGVNSFQTTTSEKGTQFQKIKIVETMDMIHDDIRTTTQDSYLGKFPNSYDNKCLLMSAIGAYFDQLKLETIISSYSVEIDVDSQRAYLKGKGIDTDSMTDEEIKVADTYDQVFLKATVKILDAIEDITLKINI